MDCYSERLCCSEDTIFTPLLKGINRRIMGKEGASMIEFDQFKTELNTKTEPLKALEQALDLDNKKKRKV